MQDKIELSGSSYRYPHLFLNSLGYTNEFYSISEVRVTLLSYNSGCLQIHLLMNLQVEHPSIYIHPQCSYTCTICEFHWPLVQPPSSSHPRFRQLTHYRSLPILPPEISLRTISFFTLPKSIFPTQFLIVSYSI